MAVDKPDFTLSPEEWDALLASLESPLGTDYAPPDYGGWTTPPPTGTTPPPTGTTGTAPRIVSIGGYDYEVTVDPFTGEDFYNLIGKTTTTQAGSGADFTAWQMYMEREEKAGREGMNQEAWAAAGRPVGGVGEVINRSIPPMPTDPLPQGYRYQFNSSVNVWAWEKVYVPSQEMTPYQQAQLEFQRLQQQADQTTDPLARERLTWEMEQWRQRLEWEKAQETQELAWRREQAATGVSQWEQEYALRQKQFEAEQQQSTARLEAERQQRLAQLRAQPVSWLQYALEAKETPVVQPWMMPLMRQQYPSFGQPGGQYPEGVAGIQPVGTPIPFGQPTGQVTQYQVGQSLPGWTTEGSLSGLDELTTPSTQYQARVGPTATQQYLGYEQARTGALPEETQWRLWNTAPPRGSYPGVRYSR